MAKRGKWRCGKCGRKFSMAAHLARHTNAKHGRGGAARAGRATSLRTYGRASATDLERRTIGMLGEQRNQLFAQRSELDSKLAAVDSALTALGGDGKARVGGPVRRGRRAGTGAGGFRKGSLKSFATKVLAAKGRAMLVREIESAVIKAGYKTRNKTLGNSLSLALAQMVDSGSIVKEGRGVFQSA